ncbi:MAG: hypothetical protein ACI82I_000207 [Gammaproteobacteria bacterium]|jgi:hypothetical protein
MQAPTDNRIQRRILLMAEHKHGDMDTSVQEKTFDGFLSMVSKGSIIIIVALILLALIGG